MNRIVCGQISRHITSKSSDVDNEKAPQYLAYFYHQEHYVNNAQNENCAFWIITHRTVVIPYRCFMRTYWPHLSEVKNSRISPIGFWSHLSKVKNSRIPPLGFWSHLPRSKIQERFFLDSWPLMTEPIGCPETSVINYHYSLRNNPEERISYLLRGWSLKSRNAQNDVQWSWCTVLLKKA